MDSIKLGSISLVKFQTLTIDCKNLTIFGIQNLDRPREKHLLYNNRTPTI